MISIVLLISLAARADLKSTAVGMVGTRAVTSREVLIQRLLRIVLADRDSDSAPRAALRSPDLDSRAFAADVTESLREIAAAREAESFNLARINADDVARAKRRATRILNAQAAWAALHVDPREFDEGLRRTLRARQFVKFRSESSGIPVTDVDVQRTYNENRDQYGNLPFEKARENIKSALQKAQTEKRLKEWFDGLLSKYQVKNLIAEM